MSDDEDPVPATYRTQWMISLLSNSIAVALSYIIGNLLSSSDKHPSKQVLPFLSVFLTALVVYSFVYLIFGYTPMGKIGPGLWDRTHPRRSP